MNSREPPPAPRSYVDPAGLLTEVLPDLHALLAVNAAYLDLARTA